jgi:hypothetical protein
MRPSGPLTLRRYGSLRPSVLPIQSPLILLPSLFLLHLLLVLLVLGLQLLFVLLLLLPKHFVIPPLRLSFLYRLILLLILFFLTLALFLVLLVLIILLRPLLFLTLLLLLVLLVLLPVLLLIVLLLILLLCLLFLVMLLLVLLLLFLLVSMFAQRFLNAARLLLGVFLAVAGVLHASPILDHNLVLLLFLASPRRNPLAHLFFLPDVLTQRLPGLRQRITGATLSRDFFLPGPGPTWNGSTIPVPGAILTAKSISIVHPRISYTHFRHGPISLVSPFMLLLTTALVLSLVIFLLTIVTLPSSLLASISLCLSLLT